MCGKKSNLIAKLKGFAMRLLARLALEPSVDSGPIIRMFIESVSTSVSPFFFTL